MLISGESMVKVTGNEGKRKCKDLPKVWFLLWKLYTETICYQQVCWGEKEIKQVVNRFSTSY